MTASPYAPGIHATALVDPQAQLHESVSIGPYTVIGPT
jgi:UDP-N-acetylglucosamine acyltransferase